ncbi:hypothetical protein GH714_008901 [Hevea brasiliensis]|uniref:Uncharacterized protein n=1 Tax=Hevea brasiliensis TaxID=3981 RepID=A0A6A6NCI9_HEVBR|nr:hypothetical protein GH714_008901 [Hevea brasiliensis]
MISSSGLSSIARYQSLKVQTRKGGLEKTMKWPLLDMSNGGAMANAANEFSLYGSPIMNDDIASIHKNSRNSCSNALRVSNLQNVIENHEDSRAAWQLQA